MKNSSVNFLVKIPIRCWDINKTRRGLLLFAAPCRNQTSVTAQVTHEINTLCFIKKHPLSFFVISRAFRHFCRRMYRLATKCATKNEVRKWRNAISVYGNQADSRNGTARLSTMTHSTVLSFWQSDSACRDGAENGVNGATADAAEVCGVRAQIRSNCWIRGLTANGFFYSEVEMLRSQWIALKYCMHYDRLSQQ